MTPPSCDCTAYGPHALGPNYYMIIGPGGVYRRFCDGDCAAQELQARRARLVADLAADLAAEVAHVA